MGRVDLREDDGGEPGSSEQDLQHLPRRRQRDATAVVRVVGQRQVGGVHRVDVEVHDDRGLLAGQRGHGLPGDPGRVGAQVVVAPVQQPGMPPQLVRVDAVRVVRVVAEQHQLVVLEHREPGADPGQCRVGSADEVRDSRGVEDAAAAALGRGQVGIAVEVGQPHVRAEPLQPRHHAEGDRTVATEHDRYGAAAGGELDRIGHRERDPDDSWQVARGPARVDREHFTGNVPGVCHGESTLAEPVEEAVVAEGRRCQVLPRVMRAGAGRSADQHVLHAARRSPDPPCHAG